MTLMTESRIRHIPVLDQEELLMGIVSIGDVVKSRLGELEDERNALVEYVNVGRLSARPQPQAHATRGS